MTFFISDHLILNAIFLIIASYITLRFVFPSHISFFISIVKSMIVFNYHNFFYNQLWSYQDSLNYMLEAKKLQERFNSPINLLISLFSDFDTIFMIKKIVGGFHFIYSLWNFIASYYIGPLPASVAFLNVWLTCVGCVYFYKLLKMMKFDDAYIVAATVFYAFHWDNIIWSSIINLKEMTIQLLLLMSFYYIIKMHIKRHLSSIIALAICLMLLIFSRFYLIPIILICFLLSEFFKKNFLVRNILFVALIMMAMFIFTIMGILNIERYLAYLNFRPVDVVFGAIRFWLTPIPWGLEARASFEIFGSWLNTLCIIPAFIYIPSLIKRSLYVKNILFLALFLTLMYATFPAAAIGSRHRVQILFIIILLQFNAIWMMREFLKHRFQQQ